MTPTARLSIGVQRCTFLKITPCCHPEKRSSGPLLRIAFEGQDYTQPKSPKGPLHIALLTNLYRMLCDSTDRLGGQSAQNGAQGIKAHPFFHNVQWNDLRSIRAPFEPQLSSNVDVSYFPIDEIPQEDTSAAHRKEVDALGDEHSADMALPFIGYTFKRFETMRN